jgi:hypothetical protein
MMYDLAETEEFDREEIATYEEVARLFPRPGSYRPIILVGPPGTDFFQPSPPRPAIVHKCVCGEQCSDLGPLGSVTYGPIGSVIICDGSRSFLFRTLLLSNWCLQFLTLTVFERSVGSRSWAEAEWNPQSRDTNPKICIRKKIVRIQNTGGEKNNATCRR